MKLSKISDPFVLLFFVLIYFFNSPVVFAKPQPHPSKSSVAQLSSSKSLKIALVLRGKDDKSFNASAFDGLTEFTKKFPNTLFRYVEASDDNSFEASINGFARKGDYSVIYSMGASQMEAVKKMAIKYPQQKFVIVDGEITGFPNIKSVVFAEHEGSYLVGAIAGMMTKSKKLGFIGGMDIPLIRGFEHAFIAGAKSINKDIQVVTNFVGFGGEAWSNPPKAKELAVFQIDSGVDIIFCAAGASGTGAFDAIEEKHTSKKPLYAIGVDSNQNGEKPGRILTSMVKEIGNVVYSISQDALHGKFEGGLVRMGLANKGVGFSVDSFNREILPKAVLDKANQIQKKIINGEIKVPKYSPLPQSG